jgi:hypothetical protein
MKKGQPDKCWQNVKNTKKRTYKKKKKKKKKKKTELKYRNAVNYNGCC